MKRKNGFLLRVLLISLAGIVCMGCSGRDAPPTEPGLLPPTDIATGNVSNRNLWGVWTFDFDQSAMSLTPIPLRQLAAHFDLTDMLLPQLRRLHRNPRQRLRPADPNPRRRRGSSQPDPAHRLRCPRHPVHKRLRPHAHQSRRLDKAVGCPGRGIVESV